MKIKPDEMDLAKKMVSEIGGPEVKAKSVWEWEHSPHNSRLMNMVRKYATKVKFGVFQVDQTFIDAAEANVGAAPAPKKKAEPKAKKAKKEKQASPKPSAPANAKGKRQAEQLRQLAAAEQKAEEGEVMYEKDLMEKGAVQITKQEAADLMKSGDRVYAIDRSFSAGLAVPPLPFDVVTPKGNVEFFKL